jgi:predicted phage baseplate assembly protein
LIASGFDSSTGEAICEITAVSSIAGATLGLDPPLRQLYKVESFSLNANVARATHGESVQEVLGAGNAGTEFQNFALKQPPLTYVSAANSSGATSTLALRVNDLLWYEVPSLYGSGPRDRVFTSRRDDAGNTSIGFGDGTTGARLPSGRVNVRARYRKGIGVSGSLKPGQLNLLLSRPPGLKAVTNPKATSGAQNPESLADARNNAPVTVLTLERAVSLTDYENFARGFAGVAKALATWFWDGYSRQIFVTIAGPGGSAIDSSNDTFGNLQSALRAAGDPFVPIRLASYSPVAFRFGAAVKVDADYETSAVLGAVEAALRSAFSFEARIFGQPVFLSQIVERVQSVPGVIALEVTRLYRPDQSGPALSERLLAALPALSGIGATVAAELLTLDPGPLEALEVI